MEKLRKAWGWFVWSVTAVLWIVGVLLLIVPILGWGLHFYDYIRTRDKSPKARAG